MTPGELMEGIRLTESLVTQFQKHQSDEMDFYTIPFTLSIGQRSANVKRFSLGKPIGKTLRRTVLVLGTDGQIHEKFIEKIVNYIINVNDGDNFRFLVDEDGTGHTNCISVYDIHHAEGFRIPYSLTIVVTPYSGDLEQQLFRDQRVAEMFREFMDAEDGINELDMICNLNSADSMNQPFLSIFGKDMVKNINNWKLSVDFLRDQGPWQEVVQHFFTVLAKMKTASLLMTKLVLNERKRLDVTVGQLQSLITTVVAKMEEINTTKKEIKHCQNQIEIDIINYNSLIPDLSAPGFFSISPGLYYELKYVKREVSHSSEDVNRMYREAEIKRNEIESKGTRLLASLQKELLQNATAMKLTFEATWSCIRKINRTALHGNSFLTQKVFDLLFDAEQHLKQLCQLEKK